MSAPKRVLITGASQGLGLGMARHFHSLGYQIVGIDLKKGLDVGELHIGDISDSGFVSNLAKSLGGHVDAIINNAAIQYESTFFESDDAQWRRVLDVNLHGAYYVSKYFLPLLSAGGAIVNISSVHARATSPGLCAYVASKGALSAMTRAMALELAPMGIRVNAVLPGAVETPMLLQGLGRNRGADAAMEKLKSSSPLKRVALPADIAPLVAFLADTSLSGNITGQEFACDSGVLAKLASE